MSNATHQTSLAVWDVPSAVAAGEHFAVKVGAKSSAGRELGGRGIEVLDGAGRVIARGALGTSPWPGTDALYWGEVELCAPSTPGLAALSAAFSALGLDGHDGTSAPFSVAVVAAPEHVLTVTVADDGGGAVEGAIVRSGPVRATTDATGRARLHLAKGRHELAVWKAGYEAPPTPFTVAADAAVTVEAQRVPETHPDSIWTA